MSSSAPIVILLLDDDEVWLRSLARRLTARGNVHCMPFSIPEHALRSLESLAVDLCVIDCSEGVGWTNARFALAVRAHLGARTPPLVLLSESAEIPAEDRDHFDHSHSKGEDLDALVAQLVSYAS